ncbi:MAG: hypothetical protein HUU47_05210 [Bacteroidetes bacterium]|nr:hypothetical protein [Bacteroidota bacterium]
MKHLLAIIFSYFTIVGFAQQPKSEILFKLQGHSDDLECMAVSENGKIIASGSWDGMVNLFTNDSFYTPISSLLDHYSAVNCISITPNAKVIATGGTDGKVFTYLIDSFGSVIKDKTIFIHRMSVNSIVIDPSGKLLFTGSNDGTISYYDIYKAKDKKINNTNPVSCIAVSRDRRSIYCSDNTNIIKKYDITGKLIGTYEGHLDQVNYIALSRDNKKLISASSDKTVKVWNTETRKLEKTLTGHDWKVISVAISLNGKYAVSGSNDGSIIVWDIDEQKIIKLIENIGTNARGVAFSNDNTKIFATLNYQPDSFETKGILVFKSGIEIQKKEPPKIQIKQKTPNGVKPNAPKQNGKPNPTSPPIEKSDTAKKIIKKTSEIEISEDKKKAPTPKKDDNRQD